MIDALFVEAERAWEAALVGRRVWMEHRTGRYEGVIVEAHQHGGVEGGEAQVRVRWDGDAPVWAQGWLYADQLGDHRPTLGPPSPQDRADISDLLMSTIFLEPSFVPMLSTTGALTWVEDRL
jgi:hypothetical protein